MKPASRARGGEASTPRPALAARNTRRLLLASWLLLMLAAWNPTVPGRSRVQDLLVVIDITQSMAVPDQVLKRADGSVRAASRLDFAKHALDSVLASLPCGTHLGWAVFTAHRSFVLMAPMEVCQNFPELQRTLARIDYRMAWAGNSEIAKGLDSALVTAHEMDDKPAIAFVTDGQEAPPINARYRPPFHGEKGAVPGVLIGVGGLNLTPIPKIDEKGRVAGTWRAKEVLQLDPRTVSRTEASSAAAAAEADGLGATTMLGATPGKEHLSALREDYLKLLADETGLGYARLIDPPALRRALADERLARETHTTIPLRTPLCVAALVLLVWAYRPTGRHVHRAAAGLAQAWRVRWRPRSTPQGPSKHL